MRTATYVAPTGELVPVTILVGNGSVRHPYHVRVMAHVNREFQEGREFECVAERIKTVIDDGKTLTWLKSPRMRGRVQYSTLVEGWGEVVVKQTAIRGGTVWRAHWPDGKHGCSRGLAHETLRDAEGFIAARRAA